MYGCATNDSARPQANLTDTVDRLCGGTVGRWWGNRGATPAGHSANSARRRRSDAIRQRLRHRLPAMPWALHEPDFTVKRRVAEFERGDIGGPLAQSRRIRNQCHADAARDELR